MFAFLDLLDTADFPARWQCGKWTALHGWIHIASDLAIFAAYFAIPAAIGYFVVKKQDVPFPRIFWLFAAFIAFCGLGHLIEATLFWTPWYRLSAVVKVGTALASWATVLALLPILPKALQLPGLSQVNDDLRREIEERKAAEEELRQSEERFRQIVKAAPNAMVMANAKGELMLVNAAAEALFGYTRQELIGLPVEVLLPERSRSIHPGLRAGFHQSPQRRAMGAGRDLHGRRKDGTEVPVEIGLNPISTPDGPAVLASIIDITERKRSEERLESHLREKDVLLKEVHHRVKNNLQVISSLLNLQADAIRNPEALAPLRESRGRVHVMALVHEKLYQGGDLARLDFADYLRELTGNLFNLYGCDPGRIRVEVQSDPVQLELDQAVPCSLIVNELLSNAFKYAFPGTATGIVHVRLNQVEPGRLRLEIGDSGVGLPQDLDWHNACSLGLQLVRMLTRQLKGELEISPGKGLTARIGFPYHNANTSGSL